MEAEAEAWRRLCANRALLMLADSTWTASLDLLGSGASGLPARSEELSVTLDSALPSSPPFLSKSES